MHNSNYKKEEDKNSGNNEEWMSILLDMFLQTKYPALWTTKMGHT